MEIKPKLLDSKYVLGISKYKNLDDVSCYIISILHILQQLPIFSDYIISGQFYSKIKNKITPDNTKSNFLIYEFFRLLKLSYENDNCNITPTGFKKLCGKKDAMWSEMEHQDSQEFLIFLISTFEKELGSKISYIPGRVTSLVPLSKIENIFFKLCGLQYLQKNQMNDFSIIKELFIGTMSDTIHCKYCKTISPSFESFITVPLSIPVKNKHSSIKLEECFDYHVSDEILDKDNMIYCNMCGLKNQSTKKIQFWKSPKILIIQLKRFIVNMCGVKTSKITNNVIYPINDLNLEPYFHPQSPYINNSKYDLLGINIHLEIGKHNLDAGHYISAVKNRYNSKWFIFNDSKEPVLKNIDELQYKNTYLLFYYMKD